jgi:hypothetical protein
MTKPSLVRRARHTWNRFREDDRSTARGKWGLITICLWLAAQSLFLSL